MEKKEAMKILKDFHDKSALFSVRTALDTVFPELKESEDERIRKAIIQCVEDMRGQFEKLYSVHHKDAIAWLERQGESNPYSGVSFKYNGHAYGMCARDNGVEIAIDCQLKAFISLDKSFVYPTYPQPTLTPKSTLEAVKEEKIDNQNYAKPAEEYSFNIESELFQQLTKEQQGLWKKEIEQAYNAGADAQKPAEWSEEDENHIIGITQTIGGAIKHNVISHKTGDMQITWLKSLRSQKQWKPSDEQIEILDMVLTNESMDDNIARILRELREQLKKLREE